MEKKLRTQLNVWAPILQCKPVARLCAIIIFFVWLGSQWLVSVIFTSTYLLTIYAKSVCLCKTAINIQIGQSYLGYILALDTVGMCIEA